MAEEDNDVTPSITDGVATPATPAKPDEPAPSNADRVAEKAAEDAAKVAAEAEANEEATPKEETPAKPDANAALDTEVWGDHGDVANATLTLIQNAGGTPEQAKALLFDAVQAGDISKVNEAELTELVGAAQAKLVLTGVKATIEDNAKQVAAVSKVAHDAAGDAESWGKVAAWAGKNVDAADMDDFRTMLSAAGRQASYAANELVRLYNADAANTSVGKGTALTPDAKGEAPVKGITSAEAGRQLALAIRKGAPRAEINNILAAKRAGKKQNLG